MSEDEGKENQPVEDQEEEAVEPPQKEATENINARPKVETVQQTQPPEETVQQTQPPEETVQQTQPPEETLLLPRDTMLSAGIHIGTRMKTLDMEPFIYRVRPDGLFVLDVKRTDDRIRVAGKFLSRYEHSRVAVAATRLYAQEPVKKFCQLTGATPLIGRFIPGQLTNPQYSNRIDPEVILVCDPRADTQAVKEASNVGIPIVALCSTDNEFVGVDLVIPTNNKGRRALAVVFWLLSRQVLRERGEIGADSDPPATIEDFEAKITREDDDDP